MPQTNQSEKKAQNLALVVLEQASEQEQSALARWAEALMQIRMSNLSAFDKAKRSIAVTIDSKTILPLVKFAGAELKRIGWSERSLPGRFTIGAIVAALTLSGSGAGIAALGGAIGLPLWVVFGAGGAFAGVVIEEVRKTRAKEKVTNK